MKSKITAGVVLRNEFYLIKKSVLSILPFVDEVIVIEDGSVDNSLVEISSLVKEYPNKIKVFSLGPTARLADARNKIDDEASGDWIIWWDADFIAFGEGDSDELSFGNMIELINNSGKHNQILFWGPNLGPVNNMTMSNKPYQGISGDTQITRKGFMRFRVDEYIDSRYYTCKPSCIYLNKLDLPYYFVHLDKVKPISRILLRDLLYTFEVDLPNAESTVFNFRKWLSLKKPDFNYSGATDFLLKNISQNLTPINYPSPKIIQGFHPLIDWYKLTNSELIYLAPKEVDSPYMFYFEESL